MTHATLPFTRSARLTLSLGALALLAACGTTPVGPNYKVPDNALVQAPSAQAPFLSSATPRQLYSAEALPPRWWHLYDDPVLDRLVDQALAHNTDLRQAAANLERVQALQAEVDDSQRPHLSVNGGPGYGHVSGLSMLKPGTVPRTQGTYSAGLSLSYQIDATGQIRRAIEAAQASTDAAQAALEMARVHVVASTARAYAGVCASGLRLQTAETSVRLQQEALQITERLQGAGRVGVIDTARARGQLEQLQASLPTLKAQRQSELFQLATLMGTPPRDFPADVATCTTPPRVGSVLPVGDGAALLKRRPDVRQAERELAAATARIGVATADLYPKITLGLSAGTAGPLSDFGRKDTTSWSLGPLISWSIPDTGAVQARIDQAQASNRGALAHFDGAVLTALRETETALDAYARELDRRASLQAARDASATVAEQARRLYRGGKTGYLDALDAERALAASEAALAASQAQLADDQINLFLALGGGWEAAPERTASPASRIVAR
ncbi:MAG TPA: TolC family protein [Candidatus Aquabacterium excrementipullorum]|nr:TolC family protein [Candidatus Aquabacterium excrementipullorum]